MSDSTSPTGSEDPTSTSEVPDRDPEEEQFITDVTAAQTKITDAIDDPLGRGYAGRIAISRALSQLQPQSSGLVAFWIAENKPVPFYTRILYLLTHGYYSTAELEWHPFYLEGITDSERVLVSNMGAQEWRMKTVEVETEDEDKDETKKLDRAMEKGWEFQLALRELGGGEVGEGLATIMKMMKVEMGSGDVGRTLNGYLEQWIWQMMQEISREEGDSGDSDDQTEKEKA